MAKPSLQASDDKLSSLMNGVKDFLAGDRQVILILGDSGAGKSTFNRHLECELWQEYKAGGRIPLFINLPALERPEKELIAEQLRTWDFSDDDILELKQQRKFILICDGYDESQLTSNLHTTNLLNQSGQWNAKLLISCRTQYLGPDYRDRFVPTADGMYHHAANDLFQEAVISPFSKSQIEDYVERYVPLEPRTWIKEDYMDKLATIPNLMDLVKNPFLLTLALESLPRVVQNSTNISSIHITRVELYDIFVEHWLGVNKRRLQSQKLNVDEQKAFEELKDDGFERNGIEFQQRLASAFFQEQDGKPVVDYSHRRDKTSWKVAFFGPEPDTSLLRVTSLLSRAGNQHRFVHRSVLEYFYSCTICGSADDKHEYALQDHTSAARSITDHPLSRKNLITEPSIAQFLAERVTLNPDFKQGLLAIIEQSKTDVRAALASANAISILVKAGVRFNGSDLKGIQIPGADLSGGQFDSVQFQGADLTGVNLSRSWIRQADFSSVQMEGVHFEELPYLGETTMVYSCGFSPAGEAFAAGLDNGDINSTATWTRVHTLRGHEGQVSSLAYSLTSHRFVSGGKDKTVRLWDCKAGLMELMLSGHTERVAAVAFSPCADKVASASDDKSVRLWDALTGTVMFIFDGHTSRVTSIAFSPNGQHIASSSYCGSILIIDTQTGCGNLALGGRGYTCIAFSPDGQRIVSGEQLGHLQLWSVDSGNSESSWDGHSGGVTDVKFSPDGQLIASCSPDSTVKLWSAQTRMIISVFTGHSSVVYKLAFSTSTSQLASCSADSTIRLWDINSAGTRTDAYQRSKAVRSVAYSSDGCLLVSGHENGAIQQYDATTGELGQVFQPGSSRVFSVAFSTDGLHIATTGFARFSSVVNARTGSIDFALFGHSDLVRTVVFSSCGQWITTGSKDKTVQLWDARSGRLDRTLVGHTDDVTTVAFSLTGDHVMSFSRNGEFRVWETDSGVSRIVTTIQDNRIAAVACSANGVHVASGDSRGNIRLWDEQKKQLRHVAEHPPFFHCLAFSSCGRWITAGGVRRVSVWKDVMDGTSEVWECMAILDDLLGVVNSVSWSPQALKFVTVTRDGTFRVWQVVEWSGAFSVQLAWSVAPAVLAASETVIVGAVGLSPTNLKYLKQRGAIDGT